MPNMAPLTQDEPCILLQTVEPGGKLVEVASGLVMASRVMHGAILAEDVAKVKFVWGGLPSGKKSTGATSPIIRPKIASADDTLKETAVAAPTTLKEPAVAAATRKEPTIAVTTRRHKQLLGALPQRPSTRRTVRQATASQPPPPKVQDMAPLDGNDVEDDDDIDAYINTGACSQDMYMPPMDEQAFRTHSDQLSRPPTVTKQRLVFTGLSQDTPPEAGNPAQVKPATVFSPNTLRKTIIGEPPKSTPATSEAPPAPEAPPSAPQAPPVGQVKKGRKRGAKKGASSSQPAPKRIRADDMVPPTPDGLPRCHEAGKPILPPDMEHLASGPMLPLQNSIQYQESVLLKEKDPNYPVFSVKVPSDQHFVNEDPADIFFIAFEDVFNLFHSKRLDYNLLQDGSRTRTKAVRYLQNFMLMHKESNTILLPVFPEDKYCTLIILDPKWSLAQYFDSSSTTTKKDYKRIRGVLDEAILGYSKNGGTFDKNGQYIRPDTKKIGFKHVINFPCIKQPAGSIKEAFYVLHHLKGFVEDAEMMSLPPSKRDPIKMSRDISDDDLREDFHRIQVKLSEIILHDVSNGSGLLHAARALSKRDVEERLHRQGDGRTWTTKDLYKPFPEPLKKTSQMTYYVVFEGRVLGVYEEWEECKKQVHKFSGNCYKGYPTRHEAVAKWRAHQAKKSKMKTFLVLSLLLTIVAACEKGPLKDQFPGLFAIASEPLASVATLFLGNQCRLTFRRELGLGERVELANVARLVDSIHLSEPQDRISWSLEPNGKFSVRSLYKSLCQGIPHKHYGIVWEIKVPLKVRIFLWQLSKHRLPSNDNIRKRRGPSNGTCALCLEVEDNNHIFFRCPLARFMWSAVRDLLGCSWNPSCFADIFWYMRVHVGQTRRVLWLACAALLWSLWNVRNKFTIEGSFPSDPANGLYKMTVYLQAWKLLARRGDRHAVELVIGRIRALHASIRDSV
ncbi:hypothetical protein QYE76_036845 [Lolium multiflorum]|uniref:Uncharacterized protein n=1 Tax=Lolium multiflorum TaxID=4521 RepID=A0AAD8VMF9_LOLMU|nr:hypothetical protein QYE76_036845 [Lolium multiflorum]